MGRSVYGTVDVLTVFGFVLSACPRSDVTPSLVPVLWTLVRPLCHEEAGSVGSAIALQHVRRSDN